MYVVLYCVAHDDVRSGEQLLNLIKQSPSSDKKHHGREDRGRAAPSIASRDMRSKARPASELEAEWRKEVDAKKAAEIEAQRQEEEKRQQEDEKERLKKVDKIKYCLIVWHEQQFYLLPL